MNFILKIVQGPNAGAEIALVEGFNVKLGRGDECDIVLADQTLPEVVGELGVETDRVMLTLPGGAQERLEPYHVKVFETTAIAVGPADVPWQALVWPKPAPEDSQEAKPVDSGNAVATPKERRSNKLLIALMVLLVLIVIFELLLWLCWPFFNSGMVKVREFCQKLCCVSSKNNVTVASKSDYGSLEELAAAYHVEVLPMPNGEEGKLLKGNLEKSVDRLRLTAEAYSIMPGVAIDLSDDESLKRASEELLDMLTGGELKVVKAKDRKLELGGRSKDVSALRHVLEALNNDVRHIDGIDCSQVELIPQIDENPTDVIVVKKMQETVPEKSATEAPSEAVTEKAIETVAENKTVAAPPAEPRPAFARLPIVGVVTTPYPYLVLRNGSRVVEGAEFNGYVISKICADLILLKKGEEILEWRP